jgi:hypothetical protein
VAKKKTKIIRKEDSKLMKFLFKFIKVFNPKFMDEYTTVIGETIYTPKLWEKMSKKKQIVILNHEDIHIQQYKRCKPWFIVSYLLLPFPLFLSYFRCKYEAEAFVINIRCGLSVDAVVDELCGPKYLFAGTFFGKKRVKGWIEQELHKS